MLTEGMWFGPRNYERFVPYPEKDADITKGSWNVGGTNLRGGRNQRRAKGRHGVWNLVWSPRSRADLRFITDVYDGLYDPTDGVNEVYFVYPFDTDNVLTAAWAAPMMAEADGMPLILNDPNFDPGNTYEFVPTPANSRGYPIRSAFYQLDDTAIPVSHYVPIPEGYRAWVGIHGLPGVDQDDVVVDSIVQVTPYSGASASAPVIPALLDLDTTTRVNTDFSSNDWSGIELALTPAAGAGDTLNGTITSMIVQILKDDETPEPGDFISGDGHMGCDFDGPPVMTAYNAKMDRYGLSAKMVEVGPWR